MALGSIKSVDSLQEWRSALKEIEKHGIFGLTLQSTGEDPLSHGVRLISISLPNSIFVADAAELGKEIVCDLGRLLEQRDEWSG